MKFYVRNMVCEACKMVVKSALEKQGFNCSFTGPGELEISESLTDEQVQLFDQSIRVYGFELMNDQKSYQIEKIKHAIFEWVNYADQEIKTTYVDYLSIKLNLNYNYLSNLFSEVTGTTIEQYTISRRIDRVKEMMVYDRLNLSEIAFRMNYSSVAHLSAQFKKVTGFTPSYFKKIKLTRLIVSSDL